jgi:hypothetical protein
MFGEISQAFGRKFLVANVLPSTLLVGANLVLMALGVVPSIDAKYLSVAGVSEPLMMLIIIAVLGVLLQQGSRTTLRLYEGYYASLFWKLAIVSACLLGLVKLIDAQLVSWRALIATPVGLVGVWLLHVLSRSFSLRHFATTESEARSGIHRYRATRRYPRQAGLVMPTKLGNVIRAFESHAACLYNIDPITAWPRLVAVLPDSYRDAIADAENNFRFVLNMSLVFAVFGVESLWLRPAMPSLLLLGCACLVASALAYLAACQSAAGWGEHVRAAFDMYRLDVLKQFGVYLPPTPMTLEQERRIWGQVQNPMFYVRDPDETVRFLPKSWEASDVQKTS